MSDFNATDTKLRILIIGSLPPPIGGTAVSLKHLMDHLSIKPEVDIHIINTSDIRGAGLIGTARLAHIMFRIIIEAFRVDAISAHFSDDPFKHLAFFIILVGWFFRKPVVFRKFGGNYFDLGKIGNWAAWFTIRRADLYLAQTHELLRLAKEMGVQHVKWYPTSRPKPDTMQPTAVMGRQCRRFVFIGHVKKEKGIGELIEAAERLPEQVSIDVYGPFTGNLSKIDFAGKRRITYHGILEPEKVYSTLMQYDALVLPTYHPGEGYPGAIIEAYMCGLPVICTRWQALPEIVDDTSGILIPPGDAPALYQAMKQLIEDDKLHQRLCSGAAARAKEFDSCVWADKFIEFCRALTRARSNKAQAG